MPVLPKYTCDEVNGYEKGLLPRQPGIAEHLILQALINSEAEKRALPYQGSFARAVNCRRFVCPDPHIHLSHKPFRCYVLSLGFMSQGEISVDD